MEREKEFARSMWASRHRQRCSPAVAYNPQHRPLVSWAVVVDLKHECVWGRDVRIWMGR